jgi:ubiquinone/menaquinone biosynthesis C-methylase UbiE
MQINSAAFDVFANTYDDNFTHSRLGLLLRPRVWEILAQHFSPGRHILELACGTGEDAVWLAKQGIYVTATDGSAAMVKQAKAKAEAEGVGNYVETRQLSLQAITNYQLPILNSQFDGVFSNFGGLNTIGEWRSLAESLAKIVKPGGKVILVPMGPFCPWEIVWYATHGQFKTAFRRFRSSASAQIGATTIPIWYPPAHQLKADFSPWFEYLHTESLGLWLPPSYLGHFIERWPGLFARLNRIEKAMAHLTKDWGDHCIIIFERKTAE